MRKIVAGLLAAVLILVALPGAALAARGGDSQATGATRPAPAGHGSGWFF